MTDPSAAPSAPDTSAFGDLVLDSPIVRLRHFPAAMTHTLFGKGHTSASLAKAHSDPKGTTIRAALADFQSGAWVPAPVQIGRKKSAVPKERAPPRPRVTCPSCERELPRRTVKRCAGCSRALPKESAPAA